MKALLTTVFMFLFTGMIFSQTARLQVIHNSPTPNVDVYVNGDLLLDNFVFRTATPFIDVPAGVNLTVGIAPANSTSSNDAIANFDYTLADGGSYVIIASGIVGGTPGFDLKVFGMGQETVGADNIGILFFHGSPDAPEVDIVAGGNPIFDDVEYGEFSGYLEVPAAEYQLAVTPANDNSTIVAEYIDDLSFWKGKTMVVFASGFLGGGDPAFEPYVALSNGGTFPLSQITTPPTGPTARVQVIHNSPSPTVDVYANGDLLLDNFVFRTATPFIDVPAGVDIELGIAPANSTSANDAIANFTYNLADGGSYVIVATGVVGGTPGFDLAVFGMGQETVGADNVGLLFFHGSPDAPEVDIVAGGNPIFDNVSYGEFSGYLEVPATSYELSVTPADDNSTVVAKYSKDFGFWKGKTGVVFASGFLGGAEPGFVPYVALSNGGTFPLDALPMSPLTTPGNTQNVIGANPQINNNDFNIFPNPAIDQVQIQWEMEKEQAVELMIFNQLGQVVKAERLGILGEGFNNMELNVGDLNSGVYFLQMRTNDEVVTKQFQILKK